MSELAIQIKGLHKSYGDVEAVKGVDLDVPSGEVFALLGPNGAGKTTTVEICEGHRSRTKGDVTVLGFDPGKGQADFKRRIGIVLQETGVERFLKVFEVIDLYRGYYPNPLALEEIIEVVGLEEKRDSLVRKLSGGQQRRLDVAIGLAGNPDLLFLDEPTTGFDPSARRQAWEMVRNLRDLGKTVFLTTHYMDEAQNLADTVAIMAGGKIVAQGSPASLSGSLAMTSTVVSFSLPEGSALPPLPTDAEVNGSHVSITTTETTKLLNELTSWALKNKVDLAGLTVEQPNLEDVYLETTARNK